LSRVSSSWHQKKSSLLIRTLVKRDTAAARWIDGEGAHAGAVADDDGAKIRSSRNRFIGLFGWQHRWQS
jgi:hypothetical protein